MYGLLLMGSISAEKTYSLDRARYEVVRNLRANYGNMVTQTDIIPSLEVLISSLRELLNDDKVISIQFTCFMPTFWDGQLTHYINFVQERRFHPSSSLIRVNCARKRFACHTNPEEFRLREEISGLRPV